MFRSVSAFIMIAFSVSLTFAKTHTFDFTPDQFRAKLNAAIIEDSTTEPKDGSTIQSCRESKKNEVTCSFKDKGFRQTVAGLKKLDLVNGDFDQKLYLTISVEAGKVSSIRLNGERGDPANLLAFYGTTMDVFIALGSKLSSDDKERERLTAELGLMRGDAADDIGKPRLTIEPYAAVKCLTVPSSISSGHVCVWTPRF